MKDSWFFDKNFNGLSDENFDDVINFFDFPLEDVEPDAVEEDWDAQFNHVEEPCYDVLSMAPLGVCDKTRKGNPKHERISTSRAEFSPIEQEPETTKVTFVKTIPNPKVTSNSKDFLQFQIYSPVSVFESSSSSSGENAFDQPAIQKRARSKRRPLSSCSPLLSVPFISSPQAFRKPRRAAAAESTSEKSLTYKTSCGLKEKGTEKDLFGMKRSSWKEPIIPRKCLHCHITKTPQWREGPMGPKTLCNACGVRYRSGRLFPEYRPAASPTFVASLHSNCHKKVLEMRNKATSEADQGSVLPLSSKPSEIR